MRFLILLTVFISAVTATVDVNRMVEDRTIICNFFGNSRCATACRYALRNVNFKFQNETIILVVHCAQPPVSMIADSSELEQCCVLLPILQGAPLAPAAPAMEE